MTRRGDAWFADRLEELGWRFALDSERMFARLKVFPRSALRPFLIRSDHLELAVTATVRPTEGTLTARLDEAAQLVTGVLDELQPELLHSSDAGQLLERFVALGKRCDAGRTLVAARAASGDEWRRERGVHTAEEWLARKTGSTKEAARRSLAASDALRGLSRTTEALKAGKLSVEQTATVTSAAAANPRAETELLTAARTETLTTLKNQAAQVKASADPDPERTQRRHHRARSARFFDEADGARCAFLRGPRDVMARLEARVQRQREQVFKAARDEGRHELPDAHTFDALMAITDPNQQTLSSSKPEMLVLADLPPLMDGHFHAGESIEIPGVGAYPLDAARELLLGDALVRLVVTHGVDVAAVITDTREIRKAVQAASLARDRGTCVIPGCGRTRNLQLHHVGSPTAYADSHVTRLDQLAWLDPDCHDDITHRGADLQGHHPDWQYKPPDPDKARARDIAKRKKHAQRARGKPRGP